MIKKEKLDSGITVVHRHNPKIHSVSMAINVKTGSANEKKDESGISHFLEHMNFKGTTNYSSKDLSIILDELGGFFNAFTSKDFTVFTSKILDENVNRASDIMIDMFMNSTYDEYEMEKEKKVVIEEMNMVYDDPDDYIFETMNKELFEGTIYEGSILGEEDTIRNLTNQKVRNYRDREYTKDNIILSIYGNCDIDEQIEKFDKAFTTLKPSKEKLKFGSVKDKTYNKIFVKDVEQAHMMMGKIKGKTDGKDFFSRKMVANILGGTMSSRLFQKIREDKGLAYCVFSSYHDFAFSDMLTITAGFPNDKVDETVAAIKLEMDNMKKNGATKEEFMRTKEAIKTALVFLHENYSTAFNYYARDLLLYGNAKNLEEKLDILNKITLEDLQIQIEDLCNTDTFSTFVLTNKEVDLKGIMGK